MSLVISSDRGMYCLGNTPYYVILGLRDGGYMFSKEYYKNQRIQLTIISYNNSIAYR